MTDVPTSDTGRRFSGRVVLVTGGSRNIGLALSRRFADDGATVVVNDVVPGEAEQAAGELRRAGHDAIGIEADVSRWGDVQAMFARVEREYGRLDVLINNAGLTLVGRVPFRELTIEDWDTVFSVNIRGAFLCTRAAVPLMTGTDPSVINISSIGATKAHRFAVAYDATKGAIEAFTRATALELAPQGIRVNAIAPGAVANHRFEALEPAQQRRETQPIPLGRSGVGDDVAGAACYLASSDAAYVTGHVLAVDGGLGVQARQASAEITFENQER